VRTSFGDQSETAKTILEENQILAQQTNAFRPTVFHVGERRDRMPLAPQQVAHPGAGPD
jgi:hypothetical protein